MINVYKEDENNLMVDLKLKEANLTNAEEFKVELIKLFDKGHKRIILNLDQVEYVDSSFLGALVASLKHIISFNCELVLVGLRKDINDLFALIRLDKVFKIYDTFNDVPAY